LCIVFLFQLGQLPSQLGIGRQDLSQPNESAHDLDIDLDSPPAF
jgi:hypothetical protein